MLVHGGVDDYGGYLNDIWIFDILKLKWSPLLYKGKFKLPQVAFHSACLIIKSNSIIHHNQLNVYRYPEIGGKQRGSRPKLEGVYVFGGIDREGNYQNTLWCIRIGSKPVEILNLKTFGKPPNPRMSCGMCYLNELNFLVIHGGKNDLEERNEILNDIMLLDLENLHWIKPVYNEDEFFPLCGHFLFGYANSIYILCGFNNDDGFSKFDFYNIEFDVFKKENEFFGGFY